MDEESAEKLHGWFSETQKKRCGSAFYLDVAGNEIEVTEVSSKKMPSGNFHDYVYVGILVSFLESTGT